MSRAIRANVKPGPGLLAPRAPRAPRVRGVAARVALTLAAACTITLASGDARAFEKQHHLGLSPGLAVLKVDNKSTASVGAGLSIHYAYGLTDQFNFLAEGGSHVVAANQERDTPDTPSTFPARVDHLGVGVGYVLDVLRWVPYFGVLGQGYLLSGGTLEGNVGAAGVAIAAGLDYQLGRRFAVGLAFRQHFIATELSTYPTYTVAQLRAEYVWGY
ncbi:MAG: outer membrane beta-barrel protein [Myxococcales bacterium]|nr:outer membrane beta-barrel protein [Myxococcales bacterium]